MLPLPTSGPFSAIKTLRTEISEHGAAKLSRVMPNLESLELTLSTESSDIRDTESHHTNFLAAATIFPHLRVFEAIYPENKPVSGTELLYLMQNCSHLKTLSLDIPRNTGVTDDSIEEMAYHVPAIEDSKLMT